ncbi:hypothetical protein H2198_010666 [Neophaeococcomyces mojaviensis]|uniref:Uncharacterized protein n=1 Tax=Neophaeococcomyces mojaviensis TaxID=3383035 RepID=A0ACC2ZRC9_9EURO|nr:hypothetical protein H2198_010666 [Knufia sp. JES_112]
MEPAASTILDSLRIEHEAKKRSLSPTKLISSLTRANTIREAPAKTTSSFAHATGSLRERDTPKFLPSLGRSFSRKNRSRPGLAGILSEQNPDQAQNRASPASDENVRPKSSSSSHHGGSLSLRSRFRPDTSGSQSTSSSRPGSKGQQLPDVNEDQEGTILDESIDSNNTNTEDSKHVQRDRSSSGNIEHYKAQIMRLEQENYRLLAENAEMKRIVRECTCGGVKR